MPVTVNDVARAVMAHDAYRSTLRLKQLEEVVQIALQLVIGRSAAFDSSGQVSIDLGNGFLLQCRVEPVEPVEQPE